MRAPLALLLLGAASLTGCASMGLGRPGGSATADSSADPATERMVRIEASQERQETLLRRTNADLSAQIEEVLRELQVLSARVAALEQRASEDRERRSPAGPPSFEPGERSRPPMDAAADSPAGGLPAGALSGALGDSAAQDGEGGAAQVAPGTPQVEGQSIYEDAYQDLMQENFQLALVGFRTYLSRYPATSLSDNAQYWIAEVYYKQKQFTTAVEEFVKVVENYAGQDKVPAAYYKLGLCFRNMRDETTARRYFGLVVERFPATHEAQLAAERLAER